jgi:hypothetical protein
MLIMGQISIEKYPIHLMPYETNISDLLSIPVISTRSAKTEKTTSAKIFLLASARKIKEIIRETASKKNVIQRSILGLPNNINFSPASAELWLRGSWV